MMPSTRMHLRAAACAAAAVCAVSAAGPLAGASAAGRYRIAGLGGSGQPWDAPGAGWYSATLEQCVTSSLALERSLTVTGQMVAIVGTQRMGMRVELQQRTPDEAVYHTLLAPGLGVWRGSEAGVRVYRYVKQITDLGAPASYRTVIHFRWVGERGRILRRAELRTARCTQPLLAPS